MSPQPETEIDKYAAPSGLASAIGETAAHYGIDIVPICAALDLDPSTFSDLTGRVSLDRLCRLLETCAVIANDEAFGLKTTDFYKAGSTGPFGYGLMTAPTALDFFRFLGENQSFVSNKIYATFTINELGAEVAFSFSPMIVKRDQYADMTAGLIRQRLCDLMGSKADAVEFHLARPKPNSSALPGTDQSEGDIWKQDQQPETARTIFSVENPHGDARLFHLMDLQCRSLREELSKDGDFAAQLREFITTRVADSSTSLSEAADYFHLSERTLQRRLAETGTSLNDLRDEVRRDLAEKLLLDTALSAAEISTRLGYSAASAFTRSTIRWFGKTPRDYRRNAG